MSQPTPSPKRLARIYPLFHFFILPILTINVLNALRHAWYRLMRDTAWEVIVALALLMLALAVRAIAQSGQD